MLQPDLQSEIRDAALHVKTLPLLSTSDDNNKDDLAIGVFSFGFCCCFWSRREHKGYTLLI